VLFAGLRKDALHNDTGHIHACDDDCLGVELLSCTKFEEVELRGLGILENFRHLFDDIGMLGVSERSQNEQCGKNLTRRKDIQLCLILCVSFAIV